MSESRQEPVRVATIVWGVILLIAAVLGFATLVFGVGLNGAALIWVVVGLGALLVFAGIAGAIAQSVRHTQRDHTLD
jgi:protein-S-isoprenylcysteine O-methyltransferase Ste14